MGVLSAGAQNVPLNIRDDVEDSLFRVMRLIEAPCPDEYQDATCAVHGYETIFDAIDALKQLQDTIFTTLNVQDDERVVTQHLIPETRWRLVDANTDVAQATFRIAATDEGLRLTVTQLDRLFVIETVD